ncbi:hypothetical protein KAS08_02840 [Candidatus Pacearchaeota archaeon]|nr:hypothetical protein [Candidatus Pacearchaeota archaeon]
MNQKLNVAKQTYYFEKEHNDCLSCGNDITHPLCPNCISKAFMQWLEKFPEESKEIKLKLNIFLRHHNSVNGKSKSCVVCGKNKTHICPYCFTEHLYNLVKEAGLGCRAMTEFLFMFNFDFEHKGYSKELEVLGSY